MMFALSSSSATLRNSGRPRFASGARRPGSPTRAGSLLVGELLGVRVQRVVRADQRRAQLLDRAITPLRSAWSTAKPCAERLLVHADAAEVHDGACR